MCQKSTFSPKITLEKNRLFEQKSGSESGNSNEIEHLLKKPQNFYL